MYLSFGVMDYLYQPQQALVWIGLRLLFAISFLPGILLLRKRSFRSKYSEHLIVFKQVFACSILNYMIATSGGFDSLYLIGLILTSMIAINIFKISPKFTLASLLLSYGPTAVIIAYTSAQWEHTALYILYFASFMLLSYIYSVQNFKMLLKGAKKETSMKEQLRKFERSELLKRQFPKSLREIIENGNNIPDRKFIANAVVGFADISNSTSLSNRIGLSLDWQLKEKFLAGATQIATQHDFVVLTQLGDGFLFLANYEETNNWHFNLIGFFETLNSRFYAIKNEVLPYGDYTDVAIKCGAAMGPTLVGFLGQEQAYFTAMGPEVNLAARLCAKAQPGEVVLSSKIWYILKSIGMPWASDSIVFNDLKGFKDDIGAVIIKPGATKTNVTHCSVCDSPLAVVKTPEGLLDLVCQVDHTAYLEKKKTDKKAA
jgi:class 3 adenylate cyclase